MDTTIEAVYGQEILDSRGNPTVEVDVVLETGTLLVGAQMMTGGLVIRSISSLGSS